MFERIFHAEATLQAPGAEVADGECVFTETPCEAAVMEMTEHDAADFGRSDRGVTLLLKSAVPVFPGCRVVCGERVWELRRVRVCRNLDGEIAAYRCSAQ